MSHHSHDHIGVIEGFARLDVRRAERTGIPEAIFAEGKTVAQVVEALRRMGEASGIALATRVSEEFAKAIRRGLGRKFLIEQNALGRTMVVRKKGVATKPTGGSIAILAAGTSDIPTAEEARVTAEVMGCKVVAHYDVGIAGIHRLLEPLQEILSSGVSAIVVVAGMEGALPSVVRGLVSVPVIGVPTSTGYGYGGHGQAALMTMLQSCAPGLTVVNIDNGFGAGATAALIANQVALARASSA
ncbi:MAG: nickel pincer cofactor biosynthesis protein LarB [Ignavibacteriales bacterium]|nr:nickel pincer cofactor biosynthesis protein LarB [Ignavibacteriales bacterium]